MQTLVLPKSWHDVTVEQFVEIGMLDSMYNNHVEKVAILSGLPSDHESIVEMDMTDFVQLVATLDWLDEAPKRSQPLPADLVALPLTKLTLGEFIDLEELLKTPMDSFTKILALLHRHFTTDTWGNMLYEPALFNLEERAILFEDLPIESVYHTYNSYLEYRSQFLKTYEELFTSKQEDDEDEDLPLTQQDKVLADQEAAKASWGWDALVYELAGGDITKYEAVFDTSLVLVFNVIAMKRSLKME